MRIRVSASSAPKGSSCRRSGVCAPARARAPRAALLRPTASPARPSHARARTTSSSAGDRPRLVACGADPGSASATLRHTRFHGNSLGSWNTTARRAGTSTPPVTLAVETCQRAQQRALAAAARTEQRDEFSALGDLEIDATRIAGRRTVERKPPRTAARTLQTTAKAERPRAAPPARGLARTHRSENKPSKLCRRPDRPR